MSRRAQLIAGAVALVLALGGAVAALTGGGDDEEPSPSTTSEASTSTSGATTTTGRRQPTYPLTGLPVDDPGTADRPTLIVKIDNVDGAARPQAGLNQADLVYEEQVEGGITRFAAVFHSRNAEVGPVRSARTTDIAIGTSFGRPLFAFSGANQVFMGLIQASPLVDLSYDWNPQLYTRVTDRPAPDNIFTPTETLYGANPGDATQPPAGVLRFRKEDGDLPAGAGPADGVTFHLGGAGVPVEFRWDEAAGGWARSQNGTPHVDKAGELIAPENLIIQMVEYVDSGARDVAGAPVPEARLLGEGEAYVLTDGVAVAGRWKRNREGDFTTYLDAEGDPVELTPGQTWIALLPPGAAQLIVP